MANPDTDVSALTSLMQAANALILEVVKVSKSGSVIGDVTQIVSDFPDLAGKLIAAVQGASAVSTEIKDIDLQSAIALAQMELEFIPQVVAALKG